MVLRWGLTIVFSLFWLLVAVANAQIFFRRPAKEGEHRPSMVPFAGGVFALLAFGACPWQSPYKWLVLFLALLLDLGSLPYLLVGLWFVVSSGEWARRALRAVAASPIIKLGIGIFGWLAIVALLFGVGEPLGVHRDVLNLAYFLATPVYWIIFLIWFFRFKPNRERGKNQ